MAQCLVDVDFLHNEQDYIFAKRILVCGITKQGKAFIKEITYPYPSRSVEKDKDGANDFTLLTKPLKNLFGNLEYHRTDLELSKTLNLFNKIIVQNEFEKEFVLQYVTNGSQIIALSTVEE